MKYISYKVELMKKSFYKSIILSVALVALGVQVNNSTTVHAETVDEQPSENEVTVEDTVTAPDTEQSVETSNEINSEKAIESQTGVLPETSKDELEVDDSLIKSDDNRVEVEPDKSESDNQVQEADAVKSRENIEKMDLIDSTTHLDEYHYGLKIDSQTGKLIDPDGKPDYGWSQAADLDADGRIRSGQLTDMIYAKWGEIGENPQTPKEEAYLALIKGAVEFLKPDNGLNYSSRAELEAYMANMNLQIARLNSYGDDGKPMPVVDTSKSSSHSSSSHAVSQAVDDYAGIVKVLSAKDAVLYNENGSQLGSSLSKNAIRNATKLMTFNDTKYVYVPTNGWVKLADVLEIEILDMNVTTNKQATLFTDDGKVVKNRGLMDQTDWHINRSAMINGQKMYHVGADEWVLADDVK